MKTYLYALAAMAALAPKVHATELNWDCELSEIKFLNVQIAEGQKGLFVKQVAYVNPMGDVKQSFNAKAAGFSPAKVNMPRVEESSGLTMQQAQAWAKFHVSIPGTIDLQAKDMKNDDPNGFDQFYQHAVLKTKVGKSWRTRNVTCYFTHHDAWMDSWVNDHDWKPPVYGGGN